MTNTRKLRGVRLSHVLLGAAFLCSPAAQVFGTQPPKFTDNATATATNGGWITTGSLSAPRSDHTATRLLDGRVLVVGGAFGVEPELYDPIAGTWGRTGAEVCPWRGGQSTATLLSDGQVLVAGECAELYDPIAGTWSLAGNMNQPRVLHTATRLADGRVLVAGGQSFVDPDSCWDYCAPVGPPAVEIYDPVARTWTVTGPLIQPRDTHTATLLPDGRVLVVGGIARSENETWSPPNAEIFDPLQGRWTNTGMLAHPRSFHTATLLPNGKVLIAGGLPIETRTREPELKSSEILDPATGTWSAAGDLNFPRFDAVATSLSNGDVLVTGGTILVTSPTFGYQISDPEVYDTTSGKWLPVGRQIYRRSRHTATLLQDGRVLVAGGRYELGGSALATAELYGNFQPGMIDPGFTGSWYDPEQVGHGLFVEVLPASQFLAAWFTFNPAGTAQSWFLGVGTYSGNTATVSAVYQPTGGRWIPNFDPSRVVNHPWGTLKFTFTDCNHGKVEFASTAGYGAGSMNLTRLTQPTGLTCP
jgi:hypothetical protein